MLALLDQTLTIMAKPVTNKLKPIALVVLVLGVSAAPLLLLSLDTTVLFKEHIPSYYFSGQFGFHLLSSRVEKIDVGFKDDVPFVWVATWRRAMLRNVQARLDVINPIEKKLVVALNDEQLGSPGFSVKNFERCGEHFAIQAGTDLQLRAADGELREAGETLSKKFPELAAGIGKAEKRFSSENYFRITTKDGFQYWYFPHKQVLLTEEQFRQKEKKVYTDEAPMDTTDKDYELRSMWGLSKTDGVRQQLYLTEKYHLSLAPTFGAATLERLAHEAKYNVAKGRENARLRGEKLVMVAADVFLDGKILASDSRYCLVLHSKTIEPDADKILSCVNREGKLLWQIITPKFKAFEEAGAGDFSGVIHKNTVAIINNVYRNKAACGLDIQTGKLLWEFSAF